MKQLGFVGLGVMGRPMVKRLLKAGYLVVGYNRTKEKARELLELGMEWSDTPFGVAKSTDVVFTMMADTDALMKVFRGPDGILAGLSPGKVYVDMGTVGPATSRELAAAVADKGANMLDAPVSGNPRRVEAGQMSIMVGGDETVLEQIRPIFEVLGPKVFHIGTNGQGSVMKIAINLSLPVQVLAFSEGLVLAEKNGVPPEVALEVMVNSSIGSPLLQTRAPFFLEVPEEALFNVKMIQKDLLLAIEMGHASEVPLPTASVAEQMLVTARGLGLEEKDFAVLVEVLRKISVNDGS